MENASKALIIAGAILLSISIIGLGIYVFSQAQGVVNVDQLKTQQIEAFNSAFTVYEGKQNGTSVKALLEKIRSHNLTYSEDATRQIKINKDNAANATSADESTTGKTTAEINTVKSSIKSGNTYEISFGYDQNSGYIIEIGIVKK